MPIDDLVNKYLLTHSDVDGHSFHPLVRTYENSFVTPLIDGYDYFLSVDDAVNALDGPPERQGIYIASWAFHPHFRFRFSNGEPNESLVDMLERKAAEGADVRVLAWVSDYVMDSGFAPAKAPLAVGQLSAPVRGATKVDVQRANLMTIHKLRSQPHLANNVIANTLNDPLGAVHTKFVLVFSESAAVGFTGGMDPFDGLNNDRYSKSLHMDKGWHTDGRAHIWHDAAAKVEGDAVQGFFDFFRSMWNTLAAPVTTPEASSRFYFNDLETNRPVTLDAVPVASTLIAQRTFPSNPATTGSLMRVQSLRTVPKPSFQPFWGGAQATSFPSNIPFQRQIIPGAEGGVFETEQALRKAIAAAEIYIYIEDQKMEGSVLFGYLRDALQDPTRPNLKLIMLTGQVDPADPPPESRDQVLREFLTDGLQQSEIDRIVFFEHQLAVVHSKVWLIDDKFAYIGSANVFNRGMFIEVEHGVSFVHEGAINQVEELRRSLWGEHFRLRPPSRPPDPPDSGDRADLFSLDNSLAIWNPMWIPSATPTLTLPTYTDDEQRFRRSWIEGIGAGFTFFRGLNSRSPSLCLLNKPLRTAFGSIETVSLGGHDYQKWRLYNREMGFRPMSDSAPERVNQPPAAPITAAGVDFIDDPTLPFNSSTSGDKGLVDEWIVLAQSSSIWHFRKIEAHTDTRIFFKALPFSPVPATLDYALLTPVLKKVPLPRPVSGLSLLAPWYFLVDDPKVDY